MGTNRLFGLRNRRNAQTTSSLSFDPSSYSPPSYAPPTEPPARIIHRKFGFVCEFTVPIEDCVISEFQPNLQNVQPQQTGQYVQPQYYGQYGQSQQYGQTAQYDQSQQTHHNGIIECNLNG